MDLFLTPIELKNYLQNINQLCFLSMEMITPKRMNDYRDYWVEIDGKKKKNPNPTPNPFTDGIFSHSKMYRLITGFNYKETVERRRKRKKLVPTFQTPSDRKPWFIHISNCLVRHKEDESKFYFMYLRCHRSMLEHRYLYQNNPIEKQLFEDYLTKNNNPYGNQGLGDDSVPVEVVSLENIKTLHINGDRIKVIHPNTEVVINTETEGVLV